MKLHLIQQINILAINSLINQASKYQQNYILLILI